LESIHPELGPEDWVGGSVAMVLLRQTQGTHGTGRLSEKTGDSQACVGLGVLLR
jgi:hypothetical protein